MTTVELLRREAQELVALLERVKQDVVLSLPPGVPVSTARDTNGRYILLDAQAALVNGYAALVAADQVTE